MAVGAPGARGTTTRNTDACSNRRASNTPPASASTARHAPHVSHSPPNPPGPQAPEAPRNPLAWLRQWLGQRLARHLSREPASSPSSESLAELARVAACLRPGDVILVEGRSRFSTGIKYLTQSTWSHAALYVGEEALADRPECQLDSGRRACVIEADLVDGVRAVDLETFAGLPLRICRPVSLGRDEVQVVIDHVTARLGHRYDLKHIFDLMRWLLPMPPIPTRFRRRLLKLGSGDPTRAICSTLVAEALQTVRYPILPQTQRLQRVDGPDDVDLTSEVLEARHASLLVPRDFDLSPYFEIVKPSLTQGFDHRRLLWHADYLDLERIDSVDGLKHPAPASGRRRIDNAVDVTPRETQASPPAAPDPTPDRSRWRIWSRLMGRASPDD